MPRLIEIRGVDDAHYAAVGKVASNWAVLERLIDSAIWGLASVDDIPGACLTSQFPSIGRRLDAFSALLRIRDATDALMKKVGQFTKAANDLQRERNRIMHDPWVLDKETGVPHRFQITADPRPVFKYRAVPTADVLSIVDKIASLIDDFDNLIRQDVIGELGSLRKTPPESSLPANPGTPA
jgi:hypothetical protein